jgi:hypothetical protein
MAAITTILKFMVKNGTQAAIKKFGKKAIREISKSITDKSLHGGPKGFQKGGSVYMQSDKDEKPLTEEERKLLERMLRGIERDRKERESMGLDPDKDVIDNFLNKLGKMKKMQQKKTKTNKNPEIDLRKGGVIVKKRKTKKYKKGGAVVKKPVKKTRRRKK